VLVGDADGWMPPVARDSSMNSSMALVSCPDREYSRPWCQGRDQWHNHEDCAVKRSSTCLTEYLQEVMVLSGNGRDIGGFAYALRRTSRGRLCRFKAVGMTKRSPTQDGARGPVNNRVVFLEPRKFQNNRNMG
jgi:hypothetical protein